MIVKEIITKQQDRNTRAAPIGVSIALEAYNLRSTYGKRILLTIWLNPAINKMIDELVKTA